MREIIQQVKIEMGLIGCDTYDQTIISHINTVKKICNDAGIYCQCLENHPYFIQLCTIYSKTFIGFKQDGSVRELPASFDKILFQFKSSMAGKV